ncbi:MAG TPA: alpha-1,4-glucan--maltose-1-phosphate maltosyltransferase [Cyclobacteriaceae bacterium]|nr:alpha-1,4-glucan--maltose-1-phosphate maltosyltransferase [Cytophagales bacterium]HNT50232.1 alpha-1,4-glucan--maltose-1-phosphate maltosyltransferase [Cyclobacteriaceae bacterium]HRF32727.1 alpha-1,4-glucan--maltose-1-phosphate maltosyltransferase [Cyclobacteriaceae bacterium]
MVSGKKRVLIENVQPQVDGGLYPAKRTEGERVDVTSAIFGDGHDHIRGEVLYKKQNDTQWTSVELTPTYNDEWQASFYVPEKGYYVFTIQAWIDHFETWYDGFKKKALAKVDVTVELTEGVILLKKLGQTNASLLSIARKLEDKKQETAIEFVLSDDFARIVHENPLRDNETRYEKEFVIQVEHRKANFSAWYEFFPRSSSLEDGKEGNFKDCIKLLPRIAAMGFDVLYFPPIHPIGKVNRKGKNNNVSSKPGEPGSPWAIGSNEGGHKAILPELGTLEDFKKLVGEAHKFGIDIAMDIAFQCAPDHPYVKDHPDWFKQRPDGSIQYAENPPKKYQDIYPFNFESDDWENLWAELKSVFFYWIEQGVTIFRIDNPHTKPIPFWQWVIAEVQKLHPDVIFLSEAFTRPRIMASLAKVGFTQSYTYFTWRVSKQELTEYMNELIFGQSRNYFRPNFWPNTPDILPYHLQHQGENAFILRYALAATLSSNYGVYGPPYEFGENSPIEGKEEYYNSEKYEIRHYDWKRTNRLTDIMSLLNKIRKENAALQSTWNLQFCPIDNSQIIAYLKATDDLSNIIMVVVNLDSNNTQHGYVQLPKAKLNLTDKINIKLHDLITDEHFTWTQEWNYVHLNPNKMPFHLFKIEIHESNM